MGPADWLSAERACVELVHRYAELADTDDADAFAQLFTAEGVWGRANGSAIEGREAIRAAYAGRTRLAGSRHVILGTFARVLEAARAETRSTTLVFRPASGRLVAILTANLDHVRQGDDGVWRIARRTSEILIHDWAPGGVA